MLLFNGLLGVRDDQLYAIEKEVVLQELKKNASKEAQTIATNNAKKFIKNFVPVSLLILVGTLFISLSVFEPEIVALILICSFFLCLLVGAILYNQKKKDFGILNAEIKYLFFNKESISGVHVLNDKSGFTNRKSIEIPSFSNYETLLNACDDLQSVLSSMDDDLLDHSELTRYRISEYEKVNGFSHESIINQKMNLLCDEIDSINSPFLTGSWLGSANIFSVFIDNYFDIFEKRKDIGQFDIEEKLEANDLVKEESLGVLIEKLKNINSELRRITETKTADLSELHESLSFHREGLTEFSVRTYLYAFCPTCNAEFFNSENLLEYHFNINATCRFDKTSGLWECRLCAEKTDLPIPIPKLYQDIVLPSARSLLEENRIERLKIYHDIDNQITKYEHEFKKEMNQYNLFIDSIIEKIKNEVMILNSEIESNQGVAVFIKKILDENMQNMLVKKNEINRAINDIKVEIMKSARDEIREYSARMDKLSERANRVFAEEAKKAARIEQQTQSYLKNVSDGIDEIKTHTKEISENTKETAVNTKNLVDEGRIMNKNISGMHTALYAMGAREKIYDKKNPVHNFNKVKNQVLNTLSGGSEADLAKRNINSN